MAARNSRPAAPNLFSQAQEKSRNKPKKKKKGTILSLPKDLNGEGALQGESKVLNEAITIAIAAKVDMDAAKGRLGASLGAVHDHVEEAWCATYANNGIAPETPVAVLNHNGESLTFVVQDKCGQNAITEEQVELFDVLLGEEVTQSIVEKREGYGFNPETLKQQAGGEKAKENESVQEVIFALVSAAISKCQKLSEEQKANMFTHSSALYLKRNTLPCLVELCGANTGKILAFLQAAGSAIVRYLKV